MKIEIPTPAAMEELGSLCSQNARPGMQIFLQGDLGAGKTTFVRGFLRGLAYEGNVKSPTYTLVEPYEFPSFNVYHFDLYRLSEPLELEAIGGRDYFDGQGICLVEWPEKAGAYLEVPDLKVDIMHLPNGRQVSVEAFSHLGKTILATLEGFSP